MSPPLSATDAAHYRTAALEACRRAAAVERRWFRSRELVVERKADASPVTRADREAEAVIRETLATFTPEFGVFGEEAGQEGDVRDRWVVDPLDGTKNFVAGIPYFAILIGLERDGELVCGAVHAPALGEAGTSWWGARGHGAFTGPGTDPAALTRPLRVSTTARVEDAFLNHGGLIYFQQAGLWTGFTELVARVRRTRGFGDWWGHMLVAEGVCDAMLEGEVAFHDVAAIRPIVEAAGGSFATFRGQPLTAGYLAPALSSNGPLAETLARLLGLGGGEPSGPRGFPVESQKSQENP
jgi:histidinol-phosphatase